MGEGRIQRPVIQPELCHSCNVCFRGCPAEVIPEYRLEKESLRGSLYRRGMEETDRRETALLPPCQEACPIHQDTKGYVALIAQGKLREALDLIREVNPLPAVCGYICHHLCEEACLRGDVDQPVPMRLLKRFVAEYEREAREAVRRPPKKRDRKILVVGSGPAGLTAANDLALLGYEVTVVEALPVLGGMLAVGIPEFRLPRDILKMEIEGIRGLGVEMKTGHRFAFDGDGRTLGKLGYDAAFLAPGCHGSQGLKIPGEGLSGVLSGLKFLRDLNLGRKVEIGRRVAVIGGGNVALDVARSAVRLGAEKVVICYRRSKDQMPAIPEEVDEAIREGVEVHYFVSPDRITGRGGKATGIKFARTKPGEPDESGRPRVIRVEGSSFSLPADTVIAAVGQRVDRKAVKGFDARPDGTMNVDPETGETSSKGVFAGGDVVTGPGWAIDAIAAGKRGARSIHEYLS